MMAYIKEKQEPGFKKVYKPIPNKLKNDEVLIKTIATSICGTDVHIYQWDKWSQKRVKPPLTVGHELVGRVVAIGKDVKKVKVGDIVSAETHLVCGKCRLCEQKLFHLCENTKIIGVDIDGCFAEYIKLPAFNLIVNKTNIDPKYLSIQEPLGNAVHTMMHFDITNQVVAIIGCGPIGLMSVNIAKALKAKKIIAIEINEYRIAFAKRLGAHVVINPYKEDVYQRVMEETDGKGVDVVTDFSGKKEAIEPAFKYIKTGGKMALLGIGSNNIEIDFSKDIVFKGLSIYGVVGRLMFKSWDQVQNLIATGEIELDKIITHFYSLNQMEQAMETMISGNCGKVVLLTKEI
jgi:threonine 3-dehydrogenase